MTLRIRNLCVRRGGLMAVNGVSFEADAGEFIALAGLNGAGKSTLLETVAGALPKYDGECQLQGKEVRLWTRRDLSRTASYLPQISAGQAGFTVRQVVAMGRFPHSGGWTESPADREAIASAMQRCHCDHLCMRLFHQLSGGERQRVLLAAVLAQQTDVLLLDEPSTHVDLPQQIQLFSLLRQQTRESKTLCIAATHDVHLAMWHATRLILLHEGRIAFDGSPSGLLADPAFRDIFGPAVVKLFGSVGQ